MRQRHLKILIISTITLFGLITIVALNSAAMRDTSAPPVSSAAPDSEPIKWPRHIKKGKYQTFRKVLESIRDNTLGPDSRTAIAVLLQDPEARARAEELLLKLQSEDRSTALDGLYAELMRAPSDPDILYACASADIEKVFENGAANPNRYGMYFSWGLSRPMIASIMAYEATGQRRFLDLVADTYERTLPFRDSELGRIDEVRGRAMHNWGTDKYAADGRYSAEITTASRVSYPIARWIKIVRSDPALQEHYGERADRFLSLIIRTIDDYESEFRWVEGTQQGFYHNVPKNQAEALNHMAWAGNLHLTLWNLTGQEKYRKMAEGLAHYFKAAMWVDADGCLVWNYQPQPGDRDYPPKEFAWKARTTIDLPLYFAEHNVVFSDTELKQIAKTFMVNIYREQGNWNSHITSDYRDPADIKDYNGGMITLSPFIQLAKYEPRIRMMIEDAVATKRGDGGWLHRSHGLVAYAYRLQHPN